jgi:hypothetical protein
MSDLNLFEQLRYHSEAYIRYKISRHVLGKLEDSREVRVLRDEVRDSVLVKTLLAERDDGRIPLHPYDKWRGAHWVLAVLADLGYPRDDDDLIPLREQVYDWLFSQEHEKSLAKRIVDGRHCCHASQEGNALFYLLELGLADERTDALVQRMLEWQWEDGGWNCDMKAKGGTSSFMETLTPLRGLALHARMTGNEDSAAAAARAAEVFLERRMYRRRSDGEVMAPDFAKLRYPCYWYYDILFGLKVLAEAGFIGDERCSDALTLLQSKQLGGGGFPAERKHYTVGRDRSGASLVDFGGTNKKKMNPFVTADAFHVLKVTDRLDVFIW